MRFWDHGCRSEVLPSRGGMPIYKQVGNRILTTIANRSVGLNLSEWHCGYRAYKVDALNAVPFESNSDGFDFDVQLTIQIHEAGLRLLEVPIPTYYGKEICDVKGLEYRARCRQSCRAIPTSQNGVRKRPPGLRRNFIPGQTRGRLLTRARPVVDFGAPPAEDPRSWVFGRRSRGAPKGAVTT